MRSPAGPISAVPPQFGCDGAVKIAYKQVTLLELDATLPPLTFIL